MSTKLPRAEQIQALLDNCPSSPGVYLMKNSDGHIIYVGKAKNLKNRVRSYFQNIEQASAKTQHLVGHIVDMEFLRAGTEVEALLLENNLIKKHKPKYNIRLKDDKTYPYIRLDVSHDFPRPYVARRQTKGESSEFYGPFPHASAVWDVLKLAAKVFKIRDCRDHEFRNRSRPCLSYEIGQCTAPCVKKVSVEEYAEQVDEFRLFLRGQNDVLQEKWTQEMGTAAEEMNYEKAAHLRDRIQLMTDILGERQRMVDTEDLRDRDVWAQWPEERLSESDYLDVMVLQFRSGKLMGRMHWSADLSEAVEGDDVLASVLLQHYQKNPTPELVVVPHRLWSLDKVEFSEAVKSLAQVENRELELVRADERPEFLASYELAKENVKGWFEEQLSRRQQQNDTLLKLEKLLSLPRTPQWMECIDISNFQGAANVASCVVFEKGRPSKENYRTYKIKSVEGQNDFASMQELVRRRYLKEDARLPDLLVVDGGRGQLSSVLKMMEEMRLDFPVIALAKARTESDFKSSEVKSSEERVFLPNQSNYKKIRDASVLRMLTYIRDEAHRFAIEFHRKQRDPFKD